jgi:hypothetical protein
MRMLGYCVTLALFMALIGSVLASPARSAFVDVNMSTRLDVTDGSIVVHWSTSGFDHYNVRWSENGGPDRQVERDGDKDFIYLTPYRAGVVYRIAVQGCESRLLGRSVCTSWDAASCGDARSPCAGPRPRPIISGGKLCLDVDAADQRRDGGRVQLWQCNDSDQQLWTSRGPQIVSLAGLCLDADFANLRNNGARVQVWRCNGSIQQQWHWQGRGILSSGGKCLDADLGGLKTNGGRVQLWDCNGSVQQQWVQPSYID